MRLGIDFGTTNSAAAVYDGSRLHPIMAGTTGETQILPSLIYVDREHQVTVGQAAAREYTRRETGRAVRWKTKEFGSIEMVVGGGGSGPIIYQHPITLTYDDAALGRMLQSIKTALRNREYDGTQIFDRFYTIDELIATLLSHLKQRAESQFGESCDSVVIGRPVKFSDEAYVSHRAEELIYKAARRAGFKDISFHMEPIGALYVYHVATSQRSKALVFDFGGGTLDLTVAEVGGGQMPNVLATLGVLVGGDDLDRRIMQSLFPYFGEDTRRGEALPYEIANYLGDWQTMPELTRPQYQEAFKFLRRTHKRPKTIDALQTLVSKNIGFSLFREIERVKRDLTDKLSTELHFIYEDIRIYEIITREKFERLITPEINQVRTGIQQVMAEAKVQPGEIDVVLRTGGSSLVPAIVELLSGIFGREKLTELDPLLSVVGGLGIIAHEDNGLRGNYRPKYRDISEPLPLMVKSKHTYSVYQPEIGAQCYVDRETKIRRLPVE
ncbi:MAG TPA: Hsp70 family protein, partial [Phototrophicaceae bacterium]|nr:Hsp70 family protein [Phototrophicaceae bacterium]